MKITHKKEAGLGKISDESSRIRRIAKQWGIVLKATCVVFIIIILKFYIDSAGYAVIPMNSFVSALLGGVFFTVGILLSGSISDYKEAEKIPGDLAASIKSMFKDTDIIVVKAKDEGVIKDVRDHIVGLLSVINSNFRRNVWKLKEINNAIDVVNKDLRTLNERGTAPQFVTRFRSELSNVDRICHRIDMITETTFIPSAYTIAEVSIASLLLIVLFVRMELNPFVSYVILGAIAGILISTVLFIKDMDSPFNVSKSSYADVDLSLLFNLEGYLKKLI
jgi:hypothetical protein